jgi:putative zinc finger/helix-turn-helix YgiT family protein
MICTNCFNDEYETITITKDVVINGRQNTIHGVECNKCSSCGDIIFTHQQSLALDKKRINLEFSSKPVLTAQQLKLLRKILNMSLEDVCDLLHIGKNSYGRWERGEVEISPSMNLLVHQLIERFPEAKANLIESEMTAEIEKAKDRYLSNSISLGEFIRNVTKATKILPDIVSDRIGLKVADLDRIENNELAPENIPVKVAVNILKLFHLTIDNLKQLFENTMKINSLRGQVSFIHMRQATYGKAVLSSQSKSINKILEHYVMESDSTTKQTINPDYMERVENCLKNVEKIRRP